MMAFPWIALDADRLGWWFRISGAWIAAKFFHLTGCDEMFEKTSVNINGILISVKAACAGLNTLQSMLIAGVQPFPVLFETTPSLNTPLT